MTRPWQGASPHPLRLFPRQAALLSAIRARFGDRFDHDCRNFEALATDMGWKNATSARDAVDRLIYRGHLRMEGTWQDPKSYVVVQQEPQP